MIDRINSMPGKEKMKHEVFAVLSGSPVSYSSVVNTDHVHWQLDYSLSGIRAWCPKVSNANEWVQVSTFNPTVWTDLVIQGRIEGTIAHHKKNLTIGAKGRVKADIHASSVLVEGQLDGDIHSDGLVSLAKGSTVNGDISCARLVLQDGACFNGKIVMVKQSPLKIAPKPEAVEESFAGSGKNKTA